MTENVKRKIIAIVGMAGAGKTEAASVFVSSGWRLVRFGQITLDEVMRRGWEVNEENEKKVREEFRRLHGMAAYAVTNIPKIEESLSQGNVVIDGMYSWSELKALREKYGKQLFVLAVYASPETRYGRLEGRAGRHGEDTERKFRSFPREQSAARDVAEIENLEKGGPIAMAEYTIVNEGSLEGFREEVTQFVLSMSS